MMVGLASERGRRGTNPVRPPIVVAAHLVIQHLASFIRNMIEAPLQLADEI